MRNSYLKLGHPFRKTSTWQNVLCYIGPAIWNRIPEILRKTKYLNTFKHKMKQYYLNDLSNPNIWNIDGFDYALAIIKNIYIYFFLMHSDWRTTMKIRLFFVIFVIFFFFSLILLLTLAFFVCCYFFYSLLI